MNRLFRTLALALVTALALTACGSENGTNDGSSSSGDAHGFNAADVSFAQSMIPHHQQAVQMARMAKTHTSTSEVKALAQKIEADQGPEIATMQGWLEDWGKGRSASESMGGMDHGDMKGMMSAGDMSKLRDAAGPSFDKMFLTMMIAHHRGAISMAKTEQSAGKNRAATSLAEKIEAAQKTEIAQMEKMLES